MGAMCTPKQPREDSMQVTQQKIDQSKCKHRVFEYIDNYGKEPTMDLIRWIDKAYDDKYTSNIMFINYPSKVNLKRDLRQAFQTLYNGGWSASFDKFLRISLKNNEELIQYEMSCRGSSTQNPSVMVNVRFKVISMFTTQGKFKTSIFKQIQ